MKDINILNKTKIGSAPQHLTHQHYSVDLHIHSVFSDGTDDLGQLLAKIREAGITIFSITDHDNIDSCKQMRNHDLSGLTYINGVELSCIYKGTDMHLLAYNFDANSEPIIQLIKQAKVNRLAKIEVILTYLHSVHNITIVEADVNKLYEANGSVGKPHVANILLDMGLGEDIHTIMHKYLVDCKASELKLDLDVAIAAIKKSGGMSVLAHPIEIMQDLKCSFKEINCVINDVKALGLDGIEAFHSKHCANDIKEFCAIADSNKLLITCGSDYHGLNKPDKFLGEESCDGSHVNQDLIKPFLNKIL